MRKPWIKIGNASICKTPIRPVQNEMARTVNQQEAVGNLVPTQLYPVQLPWPELRHSLGYWLDAVFP